MREALTLLFLITAYNLILWIITHYEIAPIPLFPTDMYQIVLVLSYNSVLYLSWLFGERYRTVQWMGYLFFFQIIALSLYFSDLEIIVRNLPPVLLTFALVVLFESPTEKEIRQIEEERESLLVELDRIRKERESVEIRLRQLESELKDLRRREDDSLSEKVEILQKEIKELREKERTLVEANRRLFQLLDMLRTESHSTAGGKDEIQNLRKERKKLIKELIQLQELTDLYAEENQSLKAKVKELSEKLEELTREKESLRLELENLRSKKKREEQAYLEILSLIPGVEFHERAVEEFIRLEEKKKRSSLRELMVFSQRKDNKKLESITTLSGVYRLRFSGGRVYLKRNGRKWIVLGILPSEKDKDKDRYIREVLSKIDTG